MSLFGAICLSLSLSLNINNKKDKEEKKARHASPVGQASTLQAAYMSFLYPTTKRPQQAGEGPGRCQAGRPSVEVSSYPGARSIGQTAHGPHYTTGGPYLPWPLWVCRHCMV